MNRYLMMIHHYFGGEHYFEITAENKYDAIVKARQYVNVNPEYSGGNYKFDSISCVKKLKPIKK